MRYIYIFLIIGVELLLLDNANAFVMLTANVADIRKLASKILPSAVFDNVVKMLEDIVEIGNKENNLRLKKTKNGKKDVPEIVLNIPFENESTPPTTTENELYILDSISFENMKYQKKRNTKLLSGKKIYKDRLKSEPVRTVKYIASKKTENQNILRTATKNSSIIGEKEIPNKSKTFETTLVPSDPTIFKDIHTKPLAIEKFHLAYNNNKQSQENGVDSFQSSSEESNKEFIVTQTNKPQSNSPENKIDPNTDRNDKKIFSAAHINLQSATLTTRKPRFEFDQYFNPNYPKANAGRTDFKKSVDYIIVQ